MTKAKPPIDRNAQEADVPMPTVENASPMMFKPTREIGTHDVLEIALMYLLELSNHPQMFPQGTLRNVAMSAQRAAGLSESALRFMVEIPSSEVSAPGPEAPPLPPLPPQEV